MLFRSQAELELGYTLVRSPLSGHISERNVDLGTLVGPGGKSLLATVVKSDTVLVDFSMTALDYLKSKERNIEIGRQDSTRSWQPNITITLADNTVYPYKGDVDFAEPQVDPQTGTFSVRAEMPNPDRVLLPGQFTRVKLLLDVREGAVTVPQKARLFQFVAVPTIALAVITTLAMLAKNNDTGKIFLRTISYTMLTTVAAAAVGLLLFILVAPETLPQEVVNMGNANVDQNLEQLS